MTRSLSRRSFVISAGAILSPLAAEAQPTGKVARVGFLSVGSEGQTRIYLNAFRQGLRELGYVEARSIAIEYRWGEGQYEPLPKLAAEPVHLKADVIVAMTAPAARPPNKRPRR
jgi:ABC-type uncharacterized transport system substrate-binding protein